MIDKYVHRETGDVVYFAGETNKTKEGMALLALVERDETGLIHLTENELKEQYVPIRFEVGKEDSLLQLCEIYKNKYEREHGVKVDVKFDASKLAKTIFILILRVKGNRLKVEVNYEGKELVELVSGLVVDICKDAA